MPNRQKVLYVVTKSAWGGAQRYIYDLATNLPKDRFEAVVLAGGNGPLFEMLSHENVRTIKIPAFRRDINPLKECAAFFQLLKVYANEQPDIIHLSSSKAGALGALAAFVYKLLPPTTYLPTEQAGNLQPKVVFTVHGWGFHEDRLWFVKKIILFISWLSSLFQDKIILLNRTDFAAAQRFIPARKLVLIPNGIKEINFLARADARALLAQKTGYPIAEDTILIDTIAELTRNKGLSYLIKAASLIHDSKFLLLVIGDGEDKNILQKEILSQGLGDTVFLTGFIPRANQYLKAMDMFVLPSLKEGLPYVVMEAMAAGLPVVATGVGGLPDLITNNQNGILIPPKDAVALSKALQVLSTDPDMRQRLGNAAAETIRTKFGFHAMIDRTTKLYESV